MKKLFVIFLFSTAIALLMDLMMGTVGLPRLTELVVDRLTKK